MKFCELLAIIACAFSFQRFSINRSFLDAGGCVIGNNARQHQWKNDLIIERDLKDHNDSHDGGMGGSCEKCAHADKGERAGIDLQLAKNVLRATAEQKSKAGANEKRRRKNAANRAGTKRRSSGKDFKNKDNDERLPHPFAAQDSTYRAVTVTADLWVKYSEGADD